MAHCTNCNQDNPEDVGICLHCAATLGQHCSSCGSQVPAGNKFCGECGARMDGQSAVAPPVLAEPVVPAAPVPTVSVPANAHLISGERRDVTVLFVDGVNFTASTGRLSNEDTFFLIDELMRLLVEIVHKYEGTVDKFTGDGLMALFGAPTAHEDDAQRAVHAALEMQAALVKRRAQTQDSSHIDFHIRIGIHTGSAIAGQLGSDAHREFTVIGDTVNLASRMESAAKPDTVLVSAATYQRTWPLFEYEEISQLNLKGIEQPVSGYRPLGTRVQPMRIRGLPGLDSPMVGRSQHLDLIKETIEQVCNSGSSRMVFVTGDAGVGKSRLVREFRTAAASCDVKHIQGHCLTYARTVPMLIVRHLLRDLIGIVENDSEKAQREKIQTYLQQVDIEGSTAGLYLLHVLGLTRADIPGEARLRIMDPATLQRQTHTVLLQIFTHEAKKQPLLFILEDMHWSDPASKAFLTYLINSTPHLPVLFIVVTRTLEHLAELRNALSGTEEGAGRVYEIALEPLGQQEASQLVSHLTQGSEGVSDALKELIAERAKGMPLYAEEIVRMLLEQEGLVWEGQQLFATHRAAELIKQVPTTVAGLILARFDQLPLEARHTLQFASVLGQAFPTKLLEAITGTQTQVLSGLLLLLANHRFLVESAYGNEAGFRFRHDLILSTIYSTLLQRNRERIHEMVGELIESGIVGAQGERIEMLAHHYSRSANRAKAVQYLLEAARNAASRSANETAVQHFGQALAYLQDSGQDTNEQYVEAIIGLSRAQKFTGALAEAGANLEQTINRHLKGGLNGPYQLIPQIVDAYRELADVRVREGALEDAILHLDKALYLLGASEHNRQNDLSALVMDRLAWIRFRQGALEEAYDIAVNIVNSHPDLGSRDPLLLAGIYNTLGGICWQKGERAEASEHVQRCLELYESMDYLWGMANALSNLGILNFRMGRWQDTADTFERSYQIRQKIGDIQGQSINLSNLGFLHMFMGNHEKARQNIEASLQIRRRLRDSWGIAQALVTLAQLAIVQRDYNQASTHIRAASELTEALAGTDIQIQSQWIMAQLEAAAGQLEAGMEIAVAALASAHKAGLTDEENDCLRVLGVLCIQNAELARAEELLIQACDHSEKHRDPYRHALAHLELGNLYSTWSQIDPNRSLDLRAQAADELEEAAAIFAPLGAQYDLGMVESRLDYLSSDQIAHPTSGEPYIASVLYLTLDVAPGADVELIYETRTKLMPKLLDTARQAGGTVERLQQGLLAVFGVPVIREDDARRTLQTAYALAELIRQQAEEDGLPLFYRIGVCRGKVVAGLAPDRNQQDLVITGSPVRMAQSLAQAAPRNRIWTEQSVRTATEQFFAFETVDDATVEYQPEPSALDEDARSAPQIVEVTGYQREPETRPSSNGRKMRLVGRGPQLQTILQLLQDGSGHGGFVLLEGEAGIGKSALAHTVVSQLDRTRFTVWSERSTEQSGQQAYGLFNELLRRAIGVTNGDRPQLIRERIDMMMAELPMEAAETSPYIELLLGLRPQGVAGEQITRLEPEQLRQQIFVAMRKLFKCLATERSLVLLLDDIQWLDPMSNQLLVFLTNMARSLPIYFLCTQRTGVATGECDSLTMARQLYPARTQVIRLGRLSPTESTLLLQEILAEMHVPEAARTFILQQSDGNPLYLEEFVRMLSEQGYLDRESEQDWATTVASMDTPASLHVLIRSRIDALPQKSRQLLQAAAVLGGTVPHSLLQVVTRQSGSEQAVEELVLRSMLAPAAESDQWVFAHPLIETIAYDSMLTPQRRILHRRAGHAIEIRWAGMEDERAEDLAHHYLHAGEIRRAVPYMIVAGERARMRYANEIAVSYFEQAAMLAASLPKTVEHAQLLANRADEQTRWRITSGLSEVYRFTGRYEEAITLLEKDLSLLGSDHLSAVQQASLYRQLGQVTEKQGKLALSGSHYQTALQRLGNPEHRVMYEEAARTWCGIAWTEFLQGRLDQARDAAHTSLEYARKAYSLNDMATVENLLGGIYWRQGELKAAQEHTQRAMDLREETGFTWGMAATRSNLGVLATATGDWPQAKSYFETSLELRSAMGDTEGVAILNNNLGTLACNMGNLDRADDYFQASLDIAVPHHIGYHIANALKGAAEVCLLRGDYPQAVAVCAKAAAQAQTVDAHDLLGEIVIVEAKARHALHQVAEAQSKAEEATQIASEAGDARLQAIAWSTLSEIQLGLGDIASAQASIEQAWAVLEDVTELLSSAHVTAQAGRIYLAQANMAQAADSFEGARTTYHNLGAELYEQQVETLLQTMRAEPAD